jgi:hypothetical protein
MGNMTILTYLGLAIVYLQLALVPGVDQATKDGYVAEANKYLAIAVVQIPAKPPIQGGVVPPSEAQPEAPAPVQATCVISYTTRDITPDEIKLEKSLTGHVLLPDQKVSHITWSASDTGIKGRLWKKDQSGNWLDTGTNLIGSNSPIKANEGYPYGLKADFNGTVCYANP